MASRRARQHEGRTHSFLRSRETAQAEMIRAVCSPAPTHIPAALASEGVAAEATGIFESDEGLVEKITTLGQPAPEQLPRSDPFDRAIKIQGRTLRPQSPEKSVTIRPRPILQAKRKCGFFSFSPIGGRTTSSCRAARLDRGDHAGRHGEQKLPSVAIGGTGGIPGSASDAAADAHRRVHQSVHRSVGRCSDLAPRLDDGPALIDVGSSRRARSAPCPRCAGWPITRTTHDAQMRSADGHVTLLLVGRPPPTRKASSARSFRCARPSRRCVPSSSGSMPQPRSP